MMFTKDAFEFITKQAVEAQSRMFQVAGAEPKDVYFLRNKDGSYERTLAEPSPRNYSASRVDDFVSLAKAHAIDNGLVMVGKGQVVCLLNEEERRERLTFVLTATKAFRTLQLCEQRRDAMDQRGFVSMLRVDLNGTVGQEIIGTFRQIKFEKNQSHESEVSNSNKGISSKITMKLAAGGKDIPDSMAVNVAVFEEFPEMIVRVDCAVETNIEEASFMLIPLAGEISCAMRRTQGEIAKQLSEQLNDSPVAVHCGEVN